MQKFIVSSLLVFSSTFSLAINNSKFAKFDNQASIGFGMSQSTTTVGSSNTNSYQLVAERLFRNGIWFNGQADANFGFSTVGSAPATSATRVSGYAGLVKGGFAFPLAEQHLQLIPYAAVGLSNYLSSLGAALDVNSAAGSARYAFNGGVGGRIEFRANDIFLVYFDQNVLYSADQTGYYGSTPAQNSFVFGSTLGVKFNLPGDWLQVGVKGFYNGYSMKANAQGVDSVGNTVTLAQPKNVVGGLITVGFPF